MLLQGAVAATSQLHPLSGTIAEWVWLLPVLPLAGFVINGLLSLNSAHFGPADPNTPGHHPHSEGAAEAPAISHGEEAGAVGDDHHAVKRHRWATLTSHHRHGGHDQELSAHPAAPFIQRYFSWMPVGDL